MYYYIPSLLINETNPEPKIYTSEPVALTIWESQVQHLPAEFPQTAQKYSTWLLYYLELLSLLTRSMLQG